MRDDIADLLDLDEDEIEELRDQRADMHHARQKARRLVAAAQSRYVEDLFLAGPEYHQPDLGLNPAWLVGGFIPGGSLVILGSTSKAGKTCFATAMAMAVAKGEPFLGAYTHQVPVLWCAFEESRSERWRLLVKFGDVPDNFYTTHGQFKIDDEYGLSALRWWVDRLGHPLIVIDPLFGATGGSLTDGRSARNALMGLKRLTDETLSTVLILHHVNKDTSSGLNRERFAESNQLLATASMDILMDSKEKSDGSREIRLQCRGRGDFANNTFLVRSTDPAHYELAAIGDHADGKAELQNDTVRVVLQEAGVPMVAEEIAAQCNAPVGTVRNRLTALTKEGTVKVVGKKERARLFALV